MSEQPIPVGVIGLGRSGWSIHALGMSDHPGFTVAAAADPEPERQQEAKDRFACTTYSDWAELVRDPAVELVVVASPSHLHAPMSCAALDAGKHVLVEKPMAATAADADAMLQAAHRNKRILMVYQIRRMDPDFRRIQEILASGVLGPVHEIRMASYGFARRHDWQTLRKFGGGQLNNNGSHLIDQALLLAGGEWKDLFADLQQVACSGDAEDHVKVVFRGRSGTVVDVELGVFTYDIPHWMIMGRYGSLIGSKKRLEWKYYDPASLPPPPVSEGPAAGRSYGTGETLTWVTHTEEMPEIDARARFYDHLRASIRDGAPLLVPPEQSRNLVALFEACHRQCGI